MTSLAGWPTGAVEGEDVVRTIFITGFPPDTKERELQNLLRWWPGYESCQLSYKGDQPMGFALFSTSAMAFAARDALQGLLFDVESNAVLRAEMAKKNLFRKKGTYPPPRLSYCFLFPCPPVPHGSYVAPGAASYDPYGAAVAAAFAAVALGTTPAVLLPVQPPPLPSSLAATWFLERPRMIPTALLQRLYPPAPVLPSQPFPLVCSISRCLQCSYMVPGMASYDPYGAAAAAAFAAAAVGSI
ncbi:unnamed protein product [Closterium sp. NIES-54]